MHLLRVLCIGRARQPFVRAAEQEYGKRIGHGWELAVEELAVRTSPAMEAERIQALEAEALLARLGPRDVMVALDPRGRSFDSAGFAQWLAAQPGAVTFAIGGALGWSGPVRARAQLVWSLSELTFAHELVRVVLAEQIYRAVSILRGEPYHR